MTVKNLFFFSILGLVSCEIAESPDSLPPTLEDKLAEVMKMPMDSPSGKLRRVVVYGFDSDQIFSTREIYYPAIGNISLHILRDKNQDTLAIGLNYYSGENVEISYSFDFQEGKAVWQSTKEYQFNSENLVDKIFHNSSNSERKLLAQYVYNSQNLLTQIEYPFVNGVELQVYEYDSLGRITSEWNSVQGQEESKYDFLVYRYSEGLLVAKESGFRGVFKEDPLDLFQYFYDEQGKVIKQKEFALNFGYQQVAWSELFYHGVNSN
ncbi:MAG: hypothetical protein PSV36_04135 [Algoriphagus sp.]|nr:hypothetical protein [Algoriphagus sp.]